MEVQLLCADPNVGSHTFTLDGQRVTIGRRSDNKVRIGDPEMSRRHCEVAQIKDMVVIRDLGSSNGTFVNGHRITQAIVKPGDSLRMGTCAFQVHYDRNSTRLST